MNDSDSDTHVQGTFNMCSINHVPYSPTDVISSQQPVDVKIKH